MINAINQVSSIGMTRGIGSLTLDGIAGTEKSKESTTPGAATGLSFGDVLGDVATKAMTDLKGAEAASFAGIKGTMSTREVVDKVMQGEQALQTATALRDKIVSAFLAITRMQI